MAKKEPMTHVAAIRLALSILEPFKEAGNIYDDYKNDEQFTDEQYDEMLAVLKKTEGPCSVLYEADGDIHKVGPFETFAELDAWIKANANGEEFDINDTRAYILYPDHNMVEISISDVEGDEDRGNGQSENEVEVEGGVMQWEDDGTIRYIDNHGNTEGLWWPADEDYDRYKADYFPNHKVNKEAEEDYE